MIKFGMIFIFIAALLYSVSILTEKKQKKLKRWMVKVFGIGFFCDVVGTSTMIITFIIKAKFNSHIFFGIAALIIMAVHFYWAVKSLKNLEKYEELFTKWSIVAWIVWMLALVTGSPLMKLIF